MTTDMPTPETPHDEPITESDLETTDAADAPDIAERLADQLEAELEDIPTSPGGEG